MKLQPSQTTDDESPLVEVENLSVSFGASPILKRINVSIERGQTVAVIGESGCGKTVFMKTLVGLIRPTTGNIRFDGEDLNAMAPAALASTRQRFGFVFQNAALFDSMNIMENVAFPLRRKRFSRETRDLVLRHLNEVGLPGNVAAKYPSELSGGMRKRVGLARALILKPELVVYDEPTTGLDPIMSDVINELMLATRKRYPVTSIVVTHDMHTARKVADRVLMFFPRSRLGVDQPQVLYDGPPSELDNASDKRVRQFVRGEAGDRLNELTLNEHAPSNEH